jgi:hypothetical protein
VDRLASVARIELATRRRRARHLLDSAFPLVVWSLPSGRARGYGQQDIAAVVEPVERAAVS